MELIHAYSLERLAQINEPQGNPVIREIKGTAMFTDTGSLGALAGDASGLRFNAYIHTIYMDFSDAIDSRTESYWVTTGWLIGCDSQGSGDWTTPIFGIDQVGIIAPSQIFPLTNYQPAYLECALNPITGVYRVYVNGIKVISDTVWNKTKRLIRLMYAPGYGYNFTMKDLHVTRFTGDEEPRLRRWKSVTLPALTSGIAPAASLRFVDGTMATVTTAETTNTYAIPAKTLGIVAQSSMLTPDGLSDLVTTMNDGTVTKTTRSSKLSNRLVNTLPRVGQGVGVGTIAPTTGATTLTVGVKAVDRA